MGYVRNKVFKLVFEDPSMDGLEVRAGSVKLKKILKLMKLAESTERSPDQMGEMLDIFSAALISWNVEETVLDENGSSRQPVPATREGLESQDFDFVFEIILAWMEGLMSVSSPLGRRSAGGAPSLEASMPMETLSPNQPS